MIHDAAGSIPGWEQVWEGPEPTAALAEEMLHGNGLVVKRRQTTPIRLFVPVADADIARALLRDREA
ncbi:MAG: hypothetical protein HY553_02110 [Elusimicrobia bacterium]|nr:hypothetical protein [Elusimicrobiota bacterium]